MDVIETAELRLLGGSGAFHAKVGLEMVGDAGLPLLLRIVLQGRARYDGCAVGAYVSLSGQLVGVRPIGRVEEALEAELLSQATGVLEGELLGRAKRWLRSWRHRRTGPVDPNGGVVDRGQRLLEAIGEATHRQRRSAHQGQLEFLELVRCSMAVFEEVGEQSQAWEVRNRNPLASLIGGSRGVPDLREVEAMVEEAEELADGDDVIRSADPEERLDWVATAAWRRLAQEELARTEAVGRAEDRVLESVADGVGVLIGHLVGVTLLGSKPS